METNSNAASAVVIYHKDCTDGFGSAWAFHTLKERDYDKFLYVPCAYGTVPSFPSDADIYVLDFSFSRDILVDFCDRSNKVLVLDHHKTAQEALENWEDKPGNLEIVFDMTRSGAGITWDYFAPLDLAHKLWEGANSPRLINYIQDRDLWKFSLPESKEISAYISLIPFDFISYNKLSAELSISIYAVAEKGSILLAQRNKYIQEIIQNARPITIHGIQGLVVNCIPQFSSEVGNELAKQSGTFGASYFQDAKGHARFSLRSIGDFDVSNLAKSFNGGGHRNAAGFTLLSPYPESSKVSVWRLESREGKKDD